MYYFCYLQRIAQYLHDPSLAGMMTGRVQFVRHSHGHVDFEHSGSGMIVLIQALVRLRPRSIEPVLSQMLGSGESESGLQGG